MPSNPPTVEDLDAEVTERCGIVLSDAGLFLRALVDGVAVSPVVRVGLRKGAHAVGFTLLDPSTLQDPDVVGMSGFALERVKDEAELYSLQQCLLGWWRVTQKEQEALSSAVVSSGWRLDQKRGVKDRVSELKAICDEPYREPTDPTVVANRSDFVEGQRNPFDSPYYPGAYRWGGGEW